MKDVRLGESLWSHWEGEGYSSEGDLGLVYATHDHVESGNEIVLRALASTLQRDGVVDSLGDGFKALEGALWYFGHSGYVDGDTELFLCDKDGETEYGDCVDESLLTTWVKLYKTSLISLTYSV